MMEFIFDTSRTVSDLLLRGVFTRHPGIEWIFTHGSDYCWTPAPGVTAQVASVDAASGAGSDDNSGSTDWRALTSRNAAKLLPRFGSLSWLCLAASPGERGRCPAA
jgi:hypothetical protein